MSSTCRFCGVEFEWALIDGKYSPVVDGEKHDCRRERYEAERRAQEAKERLARRDAWKKAHAGELRARASVLHDAAELNREFREAIR